MSELTATCPELAPPGWYLCVACAVPKPVLSAFDETSEVEASLPELRDLFPGFAQAWMRIAADRALTWLDRPAALE